MATPTGQRSTADLSDAAYRHAAEHAMLLIEQAVDQWLQNDEVDIDCARSGGMLTLTLPDRSQVIVNTQPPLKELWVAARSGGYHFRWGGGDNWVDTKTGTPLRAVLSECLTQQTGQSLII